MVDELLNKAVSSLREVAPKLNAITDAAMHAVQRVEKFLGEECSLGIPAEAYVDEAELSSTESNEPRFETVSLCYARHSGKFRIVVRTETWVGGKRQHPDDGYPKDRTESVDVVPWVSCPRDVKLKSFQHLDELMIEVKKATGRAVKETEATEEAVSNLLGALS